mmetsp:Transcript_58243/g.138619  ORF Transcript_58243/g.138619 Transcript_58243/m.138619 type:complete len:154 (-) Transcript_58243:116-577(-)
MCRTLLVKEHCERHPSVGGLTLPHHQEPRGAHEEGQPSGSQTECAPGGLSLATSECSLAPVGVVLEDERQISFVQRLHHCKDGRVETYISSPTGLRWSGTHCPLPCRCPLRCAVPSSPKESDLDEVIMLDAFPNQEWDAWMTQLTAMEPRLGA